MSLAGIPKRVTEVLDQFGLALYVRADSQNRFMVAKKVGDLVYVSSTTPQLPCGDEIVGRVGDGVDTATAMKAARWCAANSLSALYSVVDHDEVAGVAEMTVFCNVASGFARHSEIADAASEVFEALYGEDGRHARGAIGAGSLVRDVSVVLKATFVLKSSRAS